jgi:hypothetical protein
LRFDDRGIGYLLLLRGELPSTDEEQAVHLDGPYTNVRTDLNRWLPLVKWVPRHTAQIALYQECLPEWSLSVRAGWWSAAVKMAVRESEPSSGRRKSPRVRSFGSPLGSRRSAIERHTSGPRRASRRGLLTPRAT